MRKVEITDQAEEDLEHWKRNRPKTYKKVKELIDEAALNPGVGRGRPEKLKYFPGEVWSREINKGDRLIYEVAETVLIIYSARGHYDDK